MSFESLNQLSATIIGGGSSTPRRWNAATRPSSMICTQCQFVAARRPRACGVRPPDGKVHGYHEFAIAEHHNQQDAINAGEYPVFLPAPPGAHQTQLRAILFEHRVITHPGPLPAAARGCTFAGGVPP